MTNTAINAARNRIRDTRDRYRELADDAWAVGDLLAAVRCRYIADGLDIALTCVPDESPLPPPSVEHDEAGRPTAVVHQCRDVFATIKPGDGLVTAADIEQMAGRRRAGGGDRG